MYGHDEPQGGKEEGVQELAAPLFDALATERRQSEPDPGRERGNDSGFDIDHPLHPKRSHVDVERGEYESGDNVDVERYDGPQKIQGDMGSNASERRKYANFHTIRPYHRPCRSKASWGRRRR